MRNESEPQKEVEPIEVVRLTPIGEAHLRELDKEAKRRLELARKTTKDIGRSWRS